MNTLRKKRRNGLTAYGLRIWALLFAAMGMVGRGILQNRILGVGMITDQELFQVMEQNPNAMNIATAALLLQAVETCAVPIFSFLLAEGFQPKCNVWIASSGNEEHCGDGIPLANEWFCSQGITFDLILDHFA